MKNDYGRPPTKEVDTGPSCKELGVFNKYNCFSFDYVSTLILESEGNEYDKTDPRPSSPVGNFLAQNKLLWKPGTFTAAQGAATAILNS